MKSVNVRDPSTTTNTEIKFNGEITINVHNVFLAY